MPPTIISSGNTQFDILNSGQAYLLKAGSVLTSEDHGIFAGAAVTGDFINIKGTVTQSGDGTFAGIRTDGADMHVHIFDDASVSGDTGVHMTGASSAVINDGFLEGTTSSGLVVTGDNARIVNNGEISNFDSTDAAGMYVSGANATIVNSGGIFGVGHAIVIGDGSVDITIAKGSQIDVDGVALLSETSEPSSRIHLVNNGVINGHKFAIETQDGKDTIVNNLVIHGKIALGGGNDVFDNRGGAINHDVQGGAGDDTLLVSKAKDHLFENGGSEGYDTVKSTVTYTLSDNVERLSLIGKANINGIGTADGNDLFGNAGKNTLSGLAGVDSLDGGKGNDRLFGGADDDTFVFKTGNGHDTVKDFENGQDTFDVSHWGGIDNFGDVQDHLTASGGDLFITLGNDRLIIADTALSELNAKDFDFVG